MNLWKLITGAEKNGAPKIIAIEGEAGVGKSILAELLAETGANTILVRSGDGVAKVGLPPIQDSAATYIFEETNGVTDVSLSSYVDSLIDGGGVAILFSRSFDSVPENVQATLIKLRMTRERLTPY